MGIARRLVVDRSVDSWYHCVNRCVRRAFLCGGKFEHRRAWVCDRLMLLADLFAIEVAAYSVMSNHLHVVLRTSPTRAEAWSAREVARRWLRLFPRKLEGRTDTLESQIERLAADAVRIEVLRMRMADLSWFMRCLSEPIARRANREDDCTGRFWEGRSKCRRLLDERAVLACCVYTDLNPIRAGIAGTPEGSDYTSVQDRIHARQHYEKLKGLRERAPRRAVSLVPHLARGRMPRHAEDGIWLMPMMRRRGDGDHRSGAIGITLDEYLTLVDATGRAVRAGSAGAVAAHLRPILKRLEIDHELWSRSMRDPGRRFGTAVGSAGQLTREAVRRGSRWIVNVWSVHGTAASASA